MSDTLQHIIFLIVLLSSWGISNGSLVINEVAYRGSGENNCNGEDWIELLNTSDEAAVDLTNHVLHDDKGVDDEDAKTLTEDTLAPGEYLVLCRKVDFDFGIGSDDTVTLLNPTGIPISFVVLPGIGADDATETYALTDGGEYQYTATPTPGEANVITEPAKLEDKLKVQNELGKSFFRVDDDESFGKVVNIDISIPEESLSTIQDHPAWETWVSFDGLSISNIGSTAKMASSSGGGRIRVKGQSTNTIPTCVGLRNVPFNIRLSIPFLGMENFYLRNHLGDQSYMRDHAAHTMLREFGLPYLRTRPVELSINGEYIGFYTLMEAPSQGYVMQRSFDDFNPNSTALFKMKTGFYSCPQPDTILQVVAQANNDPDKPYYFERGEHRLDTPVLNNSFSCFNFFIQEVMKEQVDAVRGYLKYDKKCGLAMVEMGRVDLDYGPDSTKGQMINFLENQYFEESVTDLTDSIDTDQWLKNFAFNAVVLNFDSPTGLINNWYLATTNDGNNDWKIVQYDHNNICDSSAAENSCSADCSDRIAYWPILRLTCKSISDHAIVGRVLNSEANIQKYLEYVQELVTLLTTSDILDELYAFGNVIKDYVPNDPLSSLRSAEQYAKVELDSTYDSNLRQIPFLPFIQYRLQQVQEQLDAIQNGTLPVDLEYHDDNAVCPDWRDPNSGVEGSTSESQSNLFVESEECGPEASDCKGAGSCFDHFQGCIDGAVIFAECEPAIPFCEPCFPFSQCGSGKLLLEDSISATFLEGEKCGIQAGPCKEAGPCFDHNIGCAEDGSMIVPDCEQAIPFCEPCYPYSRCGSGELLENFDSSSLVESEECGAAAASCKDAGPCFDHTMGCAEDGSMLYTDCEQAIPFCEPCFPYSRCGSGEAVNVPAPTPAVEAPTSVSASASFVEGENCSPMLAECAAAAPCYDHTGGCAEDGSMIYAGCEQSCNPCFPYSRCGTGGNDEVEEPDMVKPEVNEPNAEDKSSSIVINEVAYSGSGEDICDGEDWIELLNTDDRVVMDLTNYVLHDDKGAVDENAKTFTGGNLAVGEYLVLCRKVDFDFGIGTDDTVTLLDPSGNPLSIVALPGTGADDATETYALNGEEYKYTTTPTPGEINIFSEKQEPPLEELDAEDPVSIAPVTGAPVDKEEVEAQTADSGAYGSTKNMIAWTLTAALSSWSLLMMA